MRSSLRVVVEGQRQDDRGRIVDVGEQIEVDARDIVAGERQQLRDPRRVAHERDAVVVLVPGRHLGDASRIDLPVAQRRRRTRRRSRSP